MSVPAPAAIAELVRLPAVLSAPGDTLVGVASSGRPTEPARTVALVASSSCMYMAGMALNDYADRDLDAEERPHRPIPSGRVSPRFALRLAGLLTGASVAAALLADGLRSLRVWLPLAGAVWGYDLYLKRTAAGPVAMSACRALDVLLGARGARGALPAAGVVGAHTAVVTTVSRQEESGSGPEVPAAALAGTLAVAAAALGLGLSRARSAAAAAGSLALIAGYAGVCASAHAAAARDPSPERLQRAVGTGVLGLMPLEAGLLASEGRAGQAGGIAIAWRVARGLARRRSVT